MSSFEFRRIEQVERADDVLNLDGIAVLPAYFVGAEFNYWHDLRSGENGPDEAQDDESLVPPAETETDDHSTRPEENSVALTMRNWMTHSLADLDTAQIMLLQLHLGMSVREPEESVRLLEEAATRAAAAWSMSRLMRSVTKGRNLGYSVSGEEIETQEQLILLDSHDARVRRIGAYALLVDREGTTKKLFEGGFAGSEAEDGQWFKGGEDGLDIYVQAVSPANPSDMMKDGLAISAGSPTNATALLRKHDVELLPYIPISLLERMPS